MTYEHHQPPKTKANIQPEQRPAYAAQIAVLVRQFPRSTRSSSTTFNGDDGRDEGQRNCDEVGATRRRRTRESPERISMPRSDCWDVREPDGRGTAFPNSSFLFGGMVGGRQKQCRS